MKTNIKLGIYGGTFNPVHTAHLIIAEAAAEQFGLDKIMFLPNSTPPHKNLSDTVSADMRIKMLEAATLGNEKFFVSQYETDCGGLSYTVNTLKHFKEIYDDIYFIIGGDSIRDFPDWYKPDEICTMCKLLVYPREGLDTDKYIERVKELFNADVFKINAPRLDISSSLVRQRIKEGRSIKYIVPDNVRKIIESNNLYIR